MNNALIILNNKDGLDVYVAWITKSGKHVPIFGKSEGRWSKTQIKTWKKGGAARKKAGIAKHKATIAAKVEKETEGTGTKNAEIGHESIDEYFGNGYDKWHRGLSKEELAGAHGFQSVDYREMNYALRHDSSKIKGTKGLVPLMGAMDRARAPKDMIVYRGVNDKRFSGRSSEMVGKVIKDKGFISTSLYQEVAERFAETAGGTKVVAKINVPKGAKVADFASDKFWSGRTSDFIKEAEIVVNRNTSYKVNSVRKSAGMVFVDMEVLLE